MKALMNRNKYDLAGTGLKFKGVLNLQGCRLESFSSKEFSVCKSSESGGLMISFSPFTAKRPSDETMLEIAERLGLDKTKPYKITDKLSRNTSTYMTIYIIQETTKSSIQVYS